jgi:hypothetical protein
VLEKLLKASKEALRVLHGMSWLDRQIFWKEIKDLEQAIKQTELELSERTGE